jgi:ABC-type phosphonate transport system ATPase subunit
MPTPVLKVTQLTKRFGAFTAVNEVSFDIQPGIVTRFGQEDLEDAFLQLARRSRTDLHRARG